MAKTAAKLTTPADPPRSWTVKEAPEPYGIGAWGKGPLSSHPAGAAPLLTASTQVRARGQLGVSG